jgi:antitoxin HicB
MTDNIEKGRIGSSFEDFLKEQGTLEETNSVAIKRVIAWQIRQLMAEQDISKVDMARRMNTSRSQLDRLLNADNDAITLGTLSRAAQVVGKTIRLELA